MMVLSGENLTVGQVLGDLSAMDPVVTEAVEVAALQEGPAIVHARVVGARVWLDLDGGRAAVSAEPDHDAFAVGSVLGGERDAVPNSESSVVEKGDLVQVGSGHSVLRLGALYGDGPVWETAPR